MSFQFSTKELEVLKNFASINQSMIVEQTGFKVKNNSNSVLGFYTYDKPYEFEGKHYVIFINKTLPTMNKELSEAKGPVTSDYQNYLEKTWLEQLSNKYNVTFNYDILYSLDK